MHFICLQVYFSFPGVSGGSMQTIVNPSTKEPLVEMCEEIEQTIYGEDGERYISEVMKIRH